MTISLPPAFNGHSFFFDYYRHMPVNDVPLIGVQSKCGTDPTRSNREDILKKSLGFANLAGIETNSLL